MVRLSSAVLFSWMVAGCHRSEAVATEGRAPAPLAPSTTAPVARSPAAARGRWPHVASDAGGRCPEGMIFIPAATFTMGAADPAKDAEEKKFVEAARGLDLAEERPLHVVKVGDYCIDRTEVTAGAYLECVEREGCSRTTVPPKAEACTAHVPGRHAHPANCVTWEQANDYCQKRGYFLPTERQWEYAARGKDNRWYPWGGSKWLASREGLACFDGKTCAVGSFPPARSPFGLDDMAGNVAEWTASSFCSYPNDDCAMSGDERTYRSSGFGADRRYERSTSRRHAPVTFASDEIGFRCAAEPRP